MTGHWAQINLSAHARMLIDDCGAWWPIMDHILGFWIVHPHVGVLP